MHGKVPASGLIEIITLIGALNRGAWWATVHGVAKTGA